MNWRCKPETGWTEETLPNGKWRVVWLDDEDTYGAGTYSVSNFEFRTNDQFGWEGFFETDCIEKWAYLEGE